jgi:ribose transport system substrate-binding protein
LAAISPQSRRNERSSLSWELTDGSPDGATTLKSKGSLFEATPAQDPYTMAKKAVEVGYGVMNGKKPEQETILIPVKLITRENVNEYQGWTK